jgi:hypothetical protein
MNSPSPAKPILTLQRILITWWPLAASWMLMSVEGPAINAVIARLPAARIHLAAYSGAVYPLALVIEAPVIMLLSASTALCKDEASYKKLQKFMMVLGAVLTVMMVAVAYTPLYDLVVTGIMQVPEEIIEPGRTGLRLMIPFCWAVGYRRFNQGVMIRFGHSRAVMNCTMVRLASLATVLAGGYLIGTIPGIVVGTVAQSVAVTLEALYSGWRLRPVIARQVHYADPIPLFTWKEFSAFYIPLFLTTLLGFLGQPIASAAISRMPRAIDSLASWGAIFGLFFLLRSAGMAYNEVVVALLDEKGSSQALRRFAILLACGVTLLPLVFNLTPLSSFWFTRVAALQPPLAALARKAFWFSLAAPVLAVLQSWFQGSILFGRRTRGITESLVVSMVTLVSILVAGVIWDQVAGLYVGIAAIVLSGITQTLWLYLRSRPIMRQVQARDA